MNRRLVDLVFRLATCESRRARVAAERAASLAEAKLRQSA